MAEPAAPLPGELSFADIVQAKSAASSSSTSAPPRAPARPTGCSPRRTSCATAASTSWWASSRPTAARKPRRRCATSRSFRAGRSNIAAWCSRRWMWMPSSRAGPRSPSSTSWPTPTCRAPAARKRWEDVVALLDEGISVISAVNIQHLESLNDVIQNTLGVTVRETVPDWVLTLADQVINLDISAEDLRQRLVEGRSTPPTRCRPRSRASSPRRTSPRCASWRSGRWRARWTGPGR